MLCDIICKNTQDAFKSCFLSSLVSRIVLRKRLKCMPLFKYFSNKQLFPRSLWWKQPALSFCKYLALKYFIKVFPWNILELIWVAVICFAPLLLEFHNFLAQKAIPGFQTGNINSLCIFTVDTVEDLNIIRVKLDFQMKKTLCYFLLNLNSLSRMSFHWQLENLPIVWNSSHINHWVMRTIFHGISNF